MLSLDKTFLRGSYPPLITPFREGRVDLPKFAELVERQVREGSHGIVVTGTTAEPSSLTLDERTDLVKTAVEVVAGRIPVVAATGSQSFVETVELTSRAEKAGADAVLVVTPYYIRPSQAGLVEYFAAIGGRTGLPLMIYHIPERAAVSVKAATVAQIAERIPNLVGIKHAANGLELVTELVARLGSEFRVFCGLEALSLPMLVVGAAGLMNAVGNLAPARVAALYEAVAQGNLREARKLHYELFELNQSIFLDTNPIPLKYMMGRLGLLESPELRLPLVPLNSERARILDPVLIRAGLLQPSPSHVRQEIPMAIASINPATGETLRTFEPLTERELRKKIDLAANAFRIYRRTSFAERARMMTRAAEILETEKDAFARIMTTEMGKPLKAAGEEAAKCATACRYYAEAAERTLANEVVATNATRSYVQYQPLGPVLAVMPWNFPFWQVFRFAAPALMAGNVALLKHASNVPQCALAVEDILRRAGFAEGVFQTLLIGSAQVERVLDDPRVVAVTLTGSEPAGRQVASTAGRQVKKSVLELGGSDPFIVMPSANLEEAADTAVKARTINNGQSCIAAKRFIIAAPVYDDFERRFVAGMQALKIGDPMDERTNIGPLATPQILEQLDEQVKRAVAAGARVLTGGKRLSGPGNYYEPTVLVGIERDSPVYREEIFGPVAMLFRAHDIAEAIEIANDSPFGLGASAWTRDESEHARFIDEIEAGQVFINGMVASDPRLPFGGVKRSGYGRELGPFGIREFVNIKTVWIKEASAQASRGAA